MTDEKLAYPLFSRWRKLRGEDVYKYKCGCEENGYTCMTHSMPYPALVNGDGDIVAKFGYEGPTLSQGEVERMGEERGWHTNSVFERARKQEIDAMNERFGKVYEFKAGMQPWIHMNEPGRNGTVPLDDDGPESYDDLLSTLATLDDEEGWYCDGEDQYIADEAGDELLVSLMVERRVLDAKIAEHARAMQAARKTVERVCNDPASLTEEDFAKLEALKRPGVMIKAEDVPPGFWSGYDTIKPITERTCSTCSKTCDVGVACWWCGEL